MDIGSIRGNGAPMGVGAILGVSECRGVRGVLRGWQGL